MFLTGIHGWLYMWMPQVKFKINNLKSSHKYLRCKNTGFWYCHLSLAKKSFRRSLQSLQFMGSWGSWEFHVVLVVLAASVVMVTWSKWNFSTMQIWEESICWKKCFVLGLTLKRTSFLASNQKFQRAFRDLRYKRSWNF